jgi:Mrp family chromosome partitioning ATPase
MDLSVSVEKAKKLLLATREPRLTLTERASMRREKAWSAPVYGQSRGVSLDPGTLRRNHCVCFFSEAKELTYYKLLRTQIMQRCKVNDWNTIMITSAVPGEGKTLTGLNLAATFAKSFGQTAILVDCDLQRQNVHRYLGIPSDRGMTDYLKNNTPLLESTEFLHCTRVFFNFHTKFRRLDAEVDPLLHQILETFVSRYFLADLSHTI